MKKKRKTKSTAEQDTVCPEPDLARARDLVMELMAIPGKSGEELEVIEAVTRRLLDAGAAKSAVRTDSAHRRIPGGGKRGISCLNCPARFAARDDY